MPHSHHLHWNAEGLWKALAPLLPGLSVEVVARSGSTNSQLIERARQSAGQRHAPVTTPGQLDSSRASEHSSTPHGRRNDDTQPCLLVAEHQTHGRGRAGRVWTSSASASLTFSLSLPLAPREWSGLSLAVGVALADTLSLLSPRVTPRIGLKWPNDLWLLDGPGGAGHGRKLGGILIETVAVGERRMCVVGVGLNVLPQPEKDMSSGFACLRELRHDIDAPRTLQMVAWPLVDAVCRFEREGLAPFLDAYRQRDLLFGQAVSTSLDSVPEGIAEGIDAHGALLLRDGEHLHALVSGEVSVRPATRQPTRRAAPEA
jgi:BirA family biotin operon repressor/biotin-[acetyl-CoA-carboxylase] ligase